MMPYTIGEMAKKMQVAPSTLRYYDKEGLLPFVERSEGGIRIFKETDFEWLFIIEYIKVFIDWCIEGDVTIDQRLALIDQQREKVLAQIQQLQETLQTLDYKHWYYQTAQAAGTCAIHEQLTEAAIPAELRPAYQHSKHLDFDQ